MNNKPVERLLSSFATGNFDVKAEEIFAKKADAEDKYDITIAPVGDAEEEAEKSLEDLVKAAFIQDLPENVLFQLADAARWAGEHFKGEKSKNPTQYGLAGKIDQLKGIEKRLRRIIEDLTEI